MTIKSFISEEILLSGWTTYHRIAAFVIAGFMLLVIVHGVRVINGGLYQVSKTAVVNAPAETIWAWLLDPDKRYLWEGGVIRVQRMRGDAADVGSTRLLQWRNPEGLEWSAFEQTVKTTPRALFVADQDTEEAERQIQIRLEALGPCRTRVSFTDLIREKDYDARFIAPLSRGRKHDRLEASFSGLNRWMKRAAPQCNEQSAD